MAEDGVLTNLAQMQGPIQRLKKGGHTWGLHGAAMRRAQGEHFFFVRVRIGHRVV